MPTQTKVSNTEGIEETEVQIWSEKAVQAFKQGLEEINQPENAIAAFKLAIKIEPQMEAAYFNLMRLYYVDKQYSELQTVLDTAKKAQIVSARLLTIYATSLRKQGKITVAEKGYSQALELDQNNLTALANMAILQDIYLHDLTKGLLYYEKYQSQLEQQNKQDARLVNWLADIKQRIRKLEKEPVK